MFKIINSICEQVNKAKEILNTIRTKQKQGQQQKQKEIDQKRSEDGQTEKDSNNKNIGTIKYQIYFNVRKYFKPFPPKQKDAIIKEIKSQAYLEMQQGIKAAEEKAAEMLRRERERFESILKEKKKISENNNATNTNSTNNTINENDKSSIR